MALRSLQTSQTRSRTGLYIIEGIRHVARAVEHGASIDSVFLDPSVLSNPFGQNLAHRLRKRGIPGVRLSSQLYEDLTLASEPQGFGAILRQRFLPMDGFRAEQNSLYIAADFIESPGSLGTIIRTAEAAGVAAIFILNPDCDPYHPATDPTARWLLVAACLGLRASEIVGLEWGDLNREDLTLLVRRSVVHGRVDETKTEASRLHLPVDPRLGDAFKEHWGRSVHRGPSDFVFAKRAGKLRWQESILERQIRPAAVRAGIGKIAGIRFATPTQACCVGWVPISKCNKSCSGTRPFKHDECLHPSLPEGKLAANSVVVRSVLLFETCYGVGKLQCEPVATERLVNGCGGWI